MTKESLREIIRAKLPEIVKDLNAAMRGKNLKGLEVVLSRVGRGGRLPHWYEQLAKNGTLPNLDGKTVGSVIEMTFAAVVETKILTGRNFPKLRINPASGVDFPDLDLGIKTPSKNFCTSEPFFSAYERLLGPEYDVLVLLTDYQAAKRKPPLKLQIIGSRYLRKSEVADRNLCALARKHRQRLLNENESRAKKVFRFLAYVNQSDWRGKHLLKLLDHMYDKDAIRTLMASVEQNFYATNVKKGREDKELISGDELDAITEIGNANMLDRSIIDAADDWVIEHLKDAGRYPNDNEWNRLITAPLDGQIGMSFALQWRYNFGSVFREGGESDSCE